MISLLITSYLQTESEIKEKTTKQPWSWSSVVAINVFAEICFELNLYPAQEEGLLYIIYKAFCILYIGIFPNTPSWIRITRLVAKWKLSLMSTVEINWFHTKKSVRWACKPVFYAFMCFYKTKNQSLWAFQSDRLIPPVSHTPAIKVTEIMLLLLI